MMDSKTIRWEIVVVGTSLLQNTHELFKKPKNQQILKIFKNSKLRSFLINPCQGSGVVMN